MVVRIAGRAWEMWVLGPTDLDDIVRYVANRRAPPADGVAVVGFHIPTDADRPVLRMLAERAGERIRSHAHNAFPNGPAGPKTITGIGWGPVMPIDADGAWLGADPMVLFDLGPLAAEDV